MAQLTPRLNLIVNEDSLILHRKTSLQRSNLNESALTMIDHEHMFPPSQHMETLMPQPLETAEAAISLTGVSKSFAGLKVLS